MAAKLEISWPRIFAEGTAIVVSILLAFSIEAWWTDRQVRAQESSILQSLLAEFQDIRANMEFNRVYNEAIRSSIRKLLRSSEGIGQPLTEAEVDQLLADLWWNQEVSIFAAPELNSIVSSGDLGIIANPELRRILGSWPVKFRGVVNTLQRDNDFFTGRLMPFLSRNSFLPQIAMAEDHMPGHPTEIYDPSGRFELQTNISHAKLLQSMEFKNILAERDVWITDILTLGIGDLEDELDSTIYLIESELGAVVNRK